MLLFLVGDLGLSLSLSWGPLPWLLWWLGHGHPAFRWVQVSSPRSRVEGWLTWRAHSMCYPGDTPEPLVLFPNRERWRDFSSWRDKGANFCGETATI